MKNSLTRFLLLLWFSAPTIPATASLSYDWTGAQAIPDNDGSGVAYNINVSDPATIIGDVAVTLNISGGFNGDLYVYLSHGDGFAVLLNRVGRTSGNDYGYANTGFAVTLSGSATADIHNYQSLSPTYNGSGQLTGTWAADGRDVDPNSALDTTPRTATLAGFDGLNPNGDWTLYFRDSSPGGLSTLNGFSLDITAVPEPVNAALGVFAGLGLVVVMSRLLWRKHRQPSA